MPNMDIQHNLSIKKISPENLSTREQEHKDYIYFTRK